MEIKATPEQLTIFALMVIAIIGMLALGISAKDIALTVVSGLVGYLSKGVIHDGKEKEATTEKEKPQ